jgi:hypothetical protein
VPADLRAELAAIRRRIMDGKLVVPLAERD